MYFTPDGRSAIVVAERRQRLDFRDPHTFALQRSVPVDCAGVDHLDFSADGELSHRFVRVRGPARQDRSAQPPRRRLPRPRRFQSAGRQARARGEGVLRRRPAVGRRAPDRRRVVPGDRLHPDRSRRSRPLSQPRRASPVRLQSPGCLDQRHRFRDTRAVVATWQLPGTSPDMGGVSADGKVLWLSGRFHAAVYAISTADGHLIASIRVPHRPHGLCVWPQPGRFSIGHTGVTR